MRWTCHSHGIWIKCIHFWRSREIGLKRKIAQDFTNFGPMLSMPQLLMCLGTEDGKDASIQYETSQSSGGKGVDDEKLNDSGITDFVW